MSLEENLSCTSHKKVFLLLKQTLSNKDGPDKD